MSHLCWRSQLRYKKFKATQCTSVVKLSWDFIALEDSSDSVLRRIARNRYHFTAPLRYTLGIWQMDRFNQIDTKTDMCFMLGVKILQQTRIFLFSNFIKKDEVYISAQQLESLR